MCEQLRVAAGEPVSFDPDAFTVTGHAIECRITAEDPEPLTPQPGRAEVYHAPSGPGVRVDSAMFGGSEVSPHYDSLIAKLIVHGRDRDEALRRLRRALREYAIDGLAKHHPAAPAHPRAPRFRGRAVRRSLAGTRAHGPGESVTESAVLPVAGVLKAYRQGWFPMAQSRGDHKVYWINPDVRGVLPLARFMYRAGLRAPSGSVRSAHGRTRRFRR